MLNKNHCVILLATYNGEKFIQEQMLSILNQDYSDYEIYISDDGSTDKTKKIIKEIISRNEYGIKITLTENKSREKGVINNFFYLINSAPLAECYFFCDQDDIWEKNKLSEYVFFYEKLDTSIPQLLYSSFYIIDGKGKVIDKRIAEKFSKESIVLKNSIPGFSIMFNLVLKNMFVKPEYCVMHDWWIVLMAYYLGEVHFLNGYYTKYRQHENNVCGIKKSSIAKRILNGIFLYKNKQKSYKNVYNQLLNFIDIFFELLVASNVYDLEIIKNGKFNTIYFILRNEKSNNFLRSVYFAWIFSRINHNS